ncbi:GNAT family N-acetyltransferase [Photorhabdus temperata]|uniref:Acetyltransferase n=1 Tax=Photorhabdus temperata subsp. temperata Meg1 TaxID=1393735 RepID=A0A081S146_PHOTE|nr:GNAT family N-acetyltransferase [Photorhabdus temperata]KER04649.1 acetyltransferase [Photorhabdus temperata subsp. temperata Meg1]MCT8346499.1 GNAT family N-acetyltransferase [Photorhabdus temperata]
MIDYSKLIIEPLGSSHDRAGFCCRVASLDEYIRKQARQDVTRRISRVFVATVAKHPNTIVGYYTLSTLAIELSDLPQHLSRKLPRHPVPAALLGRLAVNQAAQGRGVGSMLLADAIKRILAISEEIAIYAMVVDAIDEQAQRFYEQFGFSLLSSGSHRLFLPLKSV